MKKVLSVVALAAVVSLTGCDKKEEAVAEAPAAHPVVINELQGKVVEFNHVPGYTYALVEKSAGGQWLAGPSAELEVGQTVYWTEGAMMQGFTSKALAQTFDSIMFIDGYFNEPPTAAPAAPVANASTGEVISVEASAGYLYLEVDSGTGNIWVAAPMADIAQGDKISWSNASLMTNFASKSLGRTFSEIYFAGAVSKVN